NLVDAADRSGRDPLPCAERDATLRHQFEQEAGCAEGAIKHGGGGGDPGRCAVDGQLDRPLIEVEVAPVGNIGADHQPVIVSEIGNGDTGAMVVDAAKGRTGDFDADTHPVDQRGR
ncbi:hypothetical protein BLX88_26455, partial [Bacillus obstructivus]